MVRAAGSPLSWPPERACDSAAMFLGVGHLPRVRRLVSILARDSGRGHQRRLDRPGPGFVPFVLFTVAAVSFTVRMTDAVRDAPRTEMPAS